jgi:hypothetical protein
MVQPIIAMTSDKPKLTRANDVIYPFVFDSFAKAKMAPGSSVIKFFKVIDLTVCLFLLNTAS